MLRLSALCLVLLSCAPLPAHLLAQRQRAALGRGDWAEAVRLGRARVANRPFDVGARYDLACALARAADAEAAMRALHEAIALGYDDVEWLSRDEDLATLRRRADFAEVVAHAARVARAGVEVAGTRVVVRADLPCPVRLRLPADGRRLGLVVWLHPSGARLNHEVERLAPVLAARGWALAVPMAPRLEGWNDAELRALLDQTVPVLAEEVDVSRLALLGFSAGGQAALAAWAAAPNRYERVIAIGPPVGLSGHALPAPGAAPLHLVFGEAEPVRAAWTAELTRWSGLQVSTHVVAHRGHELLVDDVELLARLFSGARTGLE